jgi:hypothetical protein
VGIAGCFGVPFSISNGGAGLESMAPAECTSLASKADPLRVRLDAEEVMSGFNEAPITWPPSPVPSASSQPAGSHTRVCFPNRIFYRRGGSASIKCSSYVSPIPKVSYNSSRPVVSAPPTISFQFDVQVISLTTLPPFPPPAPPRVLFRCVPSS